MGTEAEVVPLFRVAVVVEKNRKECKSSNLADVILFFHGNSPPFSIIHNYHKRNIPFHNESKRTWRLLIFYRLVKVYVKT